MIQCSPASDMVSNQGLARLEAEDSEGVSSEATFHLNEPTIFSKSSLEDTTHLLISWMMTLSLEEVEWVRTIHR